MNPKLSICIPTYNRSSCLKECLISIIPQASIYEIPIYISDNNSNDETEKTVKSLQSLYEHIYYKKQNLNIGIDRNMLQVIEMSESEYCWWLGDDDIITEKAIEKILRILDLDGRIRFILLNGELVTNDLQHKIGRTIVNNDFNDSNSDCKIFFEHYWDKMPFGTPIVNRELLMQEDCSRFLGTSHAYSGAILEYLALQNRQNLEDYIYIYKEPLVQLRAGKKTWEENSLEIFFIQIPDWFDNLNPAYQYSSIRIKNLYLKKITSFKNIISFKLHRGLKVNNYKELIRYLNISQKLKIIFIVHIPSKLLNYIYGIYKRLKQKGLKLHSEN